MEVPPKIVIDFLVKKGFACRASDPFFHTYFRGKMVICIDPESSYDTDHLKYDLEHQRDLEAQVGDKLVEELLQYIEQQSHD
ncbi:MAG: hypothetical protein Q7J31_17815 [Syntrophales bacterium]|nr:hypothetical protein [Syntrophales bacterium]